MNRSTRFEKILDRLMPIELRPARGWTPCRYDPFFFDCSKCEIDWSACTLRSDPDKRIYLAYRRIGDPAAFASTGKSDPSRDDLIRRIKKIITLQGAAVPVTVLARYLSTESGELIDRTRIESIISSTHELDIGKNGLVNKQDYYKQRQQYLGPWWGSDEVDTGQAIAGLSANTNALDRKGQPLWFKYYRACSLATDCHDSKEATDKARQIIESDLDMVISTTGLSLYELTLLASSPKISRIDIQNDDEDNHVQVQVSKVLAAICLQDLIIKDPSINLRSTAIELKSKIVELNYPMVVNRALRYARVNTVGFADLVQQGVLGMLTAIDKFDPYFGYQFSTYATWWINQSITREIADKSRTIRMPVHVVEQLNKVLHEVRKHEDTAVNFPSSEELAHASDIPEHKLFELLHWGLLSEQLDTENELGDLIQDSNGSSTFDAAARSSMSEQVDRVLGHLQDRESRILKLRFGLFDGRPRTLEEIGGELNLTRERIRQIERKALGRLRGDASVTELRELLEVDHEPYSPYSDDEQFAVLREFLTPSCHQVGYSNEQQINMETGSQVPHSGAINSCTTDDRHPANSQTSIIEEIKNYFAQCDITVIDRRASGGALWVVTGNENFHHTQKLSNLNFKFLRSGSRASGGAPAWYLN